MSEGICSFLIIAFTFSSFVLYCIFIDSPLNLQNDINIKTEYNTIDLFNLLCPKFAELAYFRFCRILI